MTRRPFAAWFVALAFFVAITVLSGSARPAHADGGSVARPAGELRCEVQGGTELLAAANRNLACRYTRLDRRVELYTGYTGITGVNFGRVMPRTLVYRVFSPAPGTLVPLEGDFKGSSNPGAAPDELTGGSDGNVLLRETTVQTNDLGSTTLTAPINVVGGFGYLHLIYAGVVPADRRRSAATRGR